MHSNVYSQLGEEVSVETNLYHKIDDIVVTHGHSEIDITGKEYIIGHIHPKKQDKDVYHYKINNGKYKNVTILPAFSDNVDRADIDNYTGRCPLITKNTDDYSFTHVTS